MTNIENCSSTFQCHIRPVCTARPAGFVIRSSASASSRVIESRFIESTVIERSLSLRQRRQFRLRRPGLSLVELLITSTILALIAGGLAALASTVQISNAHHYGRSLTLQHGRVTLQRIQRTLNQATANEQFPGFVRFADSVGGNDYPDTLVVWHPETTASAPDGLPLINELVTFCPDPKEPHKLLEIRVPADNRPAPPLSNRTAWGTELAAIKANSDATRVVLTDLLRLAVPTNTSGSVYPLRAALRFEVLKRPSDTEWAEYKAGTRSWEKISWVQDIYGSQTGLRQSWCRIELQLRPGEVDDHAMAAALPVLGSAVVYYELRKP